MSGARNAYRHALTIEPDDAFSLRHLIDVDLRVTDIAAARQDLDVLLQKHPELAPEGHLWRASIEGAAHNKVAAERELTQAPSTTADARLDRARAYLQPGDQALARVDIDAAIRLKPSTTA